MYPHPITLHTRGLLWNVGLLRFYKEATSLKWNTHFLTQLNHCYDHGFQAFKVGLNLWYCPIEEDVYYNTPILTPRMYWI